MPQFGQGWRPGCEVAALAGEAVLAETGAGAAVVESMGLPHTSQ
ncbi:MAG TPA: hypothetical protein VI094_10930 [Propionibacteriaceae bacterium]